LRATPSSIIQEETHITNVIDPWAGSYMMEKLTQDMADAAWTIIEEVEAMGGMTKAVDSGWAKLKIEAAAADKQARIDSGQDVIVGVNKYKLKTEDAIEARDIDNVAVRDGADRPAPSTSRQNATAALVACCAGCYRFCSRRAGTGNLLDLSHQGHPPARHGGRGERRAGERLRPPPRRHQQGDRRVRRRLRHAPHGDTMEYWNALKADIAAFAEDQGRRPRVMIAQAGPGRPRPRRQGGGHRVCRPGL